jgi:hypothetical protein
MAESKVKLPNGEQVTIRHKDGASEQDVLQFAFSEYVVNQDPGTVIGRSIAQGIDNLQQAYGSSLEGIGNVLDAESLQQMGGDIVAKNQAQIDARRFREQESLTDREGVAGAFDYVAELAGQSAPQMVTTFAGAGAGAAIGGAIGSLGGPLAPLTVPIGTFAGGFLANMPYFYGSNRERQKEAIEKGYKVEVDEGAAALAAIPQSALDAVFATVARAGVKFLGTPKMKLQGGILTKATLAAGGGSIVEAPTEIGQTVLERYQAGLPLDNDEALKEIVAAGVGGAVLGGLFGGAGGAVAGIRTPKETKAVEEKEQGERQTFTVNYTNESTGQPASTQVEADNEQQAQEIANKSLKKTARKGTIVVQRPVEPEPAPTPETEPEVTAGAAAVGLTPKEFTSRLKDTTVVDNEGKPLRVYRGTRNIEFETEGRGRVPSFTSSPDVASTYSSTMRGGPFNISLSFKEGASVSPVFLSMKKPLDFTAEENLMSLGNYLAYMEYGNEKVTGKDGITKEEVDELINYMVRRGRGETEAKGNFLFRLDDSFTTSGYDRPLDFSNIRDEYSDLIDFKNEYDDYLDNNLSLEDSAIQDGLYFDQFIAADAPVTKRVAERLGFDGIIHKDVFGVKEEYEQLTGKKVEGLTQEKREDGLSIIEDDIHITYRPFSEEQVIGSLQQPEVTAGAAPVTTEDYNLLNSPFIKGYSGPGPQDTSVPNYNSFHYVLNNPQRQALSSAIESGAVDALADNLVQETTEMMKDPSVSAGMGWYGRMRTRLNQIFGGDRDLFTHLLGTTSAQTAVEQNFRYSVDLYNRFKAGEFDSKIKKYLELKGRLQAGDLGKLLIRIKAKNSDGKVYTEQLIKKSKDSALLQAAARHYDLLPKQKNGKLYGANSYPALKALSQVWFDDRLGPNRMTPKTPQFAMNLNGQSLEATIDVWAARSLRRIIYKGQPEARIVPSEETAVSNPDFALGQLIFGRAAKKLNMNPDDLQAVIWFGEKKIWDQNGWTGAAGALKSSFDEPANVFYPIDGTTRSEADANLILDFLASERLVQRDIAFPEAVSLTTQANNRKKYDEYIRTSVISDFLESRGRREVYESESVESDRRRQVTRAINRLRGFSGKVRYRKGTGKEPKRSLGVIERGSVLSGKQFSAIAKRNQRGNKFGSSVDVLSEAKYKGYDLIVIESGPGANVTLSISPDGEVGSVTKSKKATSLDVAAAFDMAISTGKVKFLNGFETILPDKYASYGFVPVARLKFDPSQKPPGWSTQTYKKYNNGEPDVIFMRLGGRIGGTYDPTGFPEVSTYEEGVALSKDIIAEAAPTEPGGTFNQNTLYDFITDNFLPVSRKIGVDIVTNYRIPMARYNASEGVIEYNPTALAQQDQQYITAAMREEMIHAAMSKVILQKAKGKKEGEAFQSFMSSLGKSLTPEQRTAIAEVYSGLETDAQFGAEYSRAAIQQLLYGDVTESFITQGPAFTKLKNLLRSVQSYLARTFGADVTTDPEAAGIIRASAELLQAADPNARPTNQKVVDESLAYSASVNPNAEVTSQEVAESGKPPSQKKLNINFARKYLFTLSSLLNSIHPRLKRLVRDYYGAIQGRVLNYQTRTAPFFKKYRGIKNEKDKRRLKQLLLYSPLGDPADDPLIQEQNRLLRKYDMLNDYNLEVRPVLDELRANLEAEGLEIGYLPEYMPRRIKDLDKIKKRSGNELNEAFKNYIDERNRKIQEAEGRVLAAQLNPDPNVVPTEADLKLAGEVVIEIGSDRTAAFEAQQWDVFTMGTKTRGGSKIPGNLKERTAYLDDVIPDDLLDAYEDPSVAMENYIFGIVSATENVKLVGRRFTTEGDKIKVPVASELGELIQELRANGEISNENADGTVPDIFRMILTAQQGERIYLQIARTFGYGTLLVEFTSTLSQLYDLPFIMLDNGVLGTAGAMFGQRLKGEDFGIDTQQVSAEFASDNRALEKAVRLGLKATGFTKLDQIMKETNLTANYNRYRKLSRGYYKDRKSGNSKKFVAELTAMGYSEQEQVKLIADLKEGKRNSAYIRSLLFNKLAETQPLTQAEMALGIVNNPNLRLFVAMKSFMVKQLNFVKDRMLVNMARGTKAQRIKASKELALLLTFMVMAGFPVDALKDFLAGRIGYMSDYLFNGIFRIAGISRYTAYQARKEGLGQASLDFVTPVAIQQFVDITSEMGRVATGQKAITESKFVTLLPFSDVINRIFGFQKERERREYMRRSREGERPFLIPAGAI